MEMTEKDIETWQKDIVILLDLAYKSEDRMVIGFTLRFAATYFFLRNKVNVAIDFAKQATKFFSPKSDFQLWLQQDIARYSKKSVNSISQ
jgi:hypothetical protein